MPHMTQCGHHKFKEARLWYTVLSNEIDSAQKFIFLGRDIFTLYNNSNEILIVLLADSFGV